MTADLILKLALSLITRVIEWTGDPGDDIPVDDLLITRSLDDAIEEATEKKKQ